jgi:hypothetical protein
MSLALVSGFGSLAQETKQMAIIRIAAMVRKVEFMALATNTSGARAQQLIPGSDIVS